MWAKHLAAFWGAKGIFWQFFQYNIKFILHTSSLMETLSHVFKAQLFWKGHKNSKKISHLFWRYWVKTTVLSKQVGDAFKFCGLLIISELYPLDWVRLRCKHCIYQFSDNRNQDNILPINLRKLKKYNWTFKNRGLWHFNCMICPLPSPPTYTHKQEKLGYVRPDIVCNWVIRQLPTYIPWTPHYLT